MENQRQEQLQALKDVNEYCVKLEKGIHEILDELRTESKPDTDDFLNQIITGINWVVEVVNLIMPVLNEGKERINKEGVNSIIISLSEALQEKDHPRVADLMENGIIEFIESIESVADEILE